GFFHSHGIFLLTPHVHPSLIQPKNKTQGYHEFLPAAVSAAAQGAVTEAEAVVAVAIAAPGAAVYLTQAAAAAEAEAQAALAVDHPILPVIFFNDLGLPDGGFPV
ncbi:hypothetical protein VaNZ11_011227, partial [Volvox africanus]